MRRQQEFRLHAHRIPPAEPSASRAHRLPSEASSDPTDGDFLDTELKKGPKRPVQERRAAARTRRFERLVEDSYKRVQLPPA